MDTLGNPWQHIATLIRGGQVRGVQGWSSALSPKAAAAAAAAEARAAAAAAAEGVLSSPSSACATPLAVEPLPGRLASDEVHDTVAAAAALLELSTGGRKRRLTYADASTESEEGGSPPVQSKGPVVFKSELPEADRLSEAHSDHTCMQGQHQHAGSTAMSAQHMQQQQQQRHSSPATPPGLSSPATPASASPAAAASAAAAAAAAAAVSNANIAPPAIELLPHQRRVQLHMIEQMLDATNTKFSTNNGVVAPRKFWPKLEGGGTAPTQLQVLVHAPNWSTSEYVSNSLARLAAAVQANDSAALAADDGSSVAYALLWKHFLAVTESDEASQHHRLAPGGKGSLHAATAGGHTLVFGPYAALVVAGGSMMRIRGIKHNGELKLLINTPHTLVLREKLGANMLRLHVVLNPSEGAEGPAVMQSDFAFAPLYGKLGGREDAYTQEIRRAASSKRNKPMTQDMTMHQAAAAAAGAPAYHSFGGAAAAAAYPAPAAPAAAAGPGGMQQQRSRSSSTPPPAAFSAEAMPHFLAFANEMAAAAAAAAAVTHPGTAAGVLDTEQMAPQDIAQAVAAAMAALRRRQQEVADLQH